VHCVSAWLTTDLVTYFHVQLMHVAPGQQLFYYGSRVWPDNVRKQMYDQFGGMPKDLAPAHDYDPKVVHLSLPLSLPLSRARPLSLRNFLFSFGQQGRGQALSTVLGL
jgi:hypothetical protein